MYQPDTIPPKTETEPTMERVGHPPILIERRSASDTVFLVDDTQFRSTMPRPTHWSIAWSDLMMTMFILFLSMFVYQTAQMDFLAKEEPEVIGGDTTDALDSEQFSGDGLSFSPIDPAMPLMTAGTIPKAVPDETLPPPEDVFEAAAVPPEELLERLDIPVENAAPVSAEIPQPLPAEPAVTDTGADPQTTEAEQPPTGQFNDIYRQSKETVSANNLEKFASLELVQDKTMRIILTGDLLFAPGKADLSLESVASLEKIATAIQQTPYIINVVGHTDNVPMHSPLYASNWELSLARASTVARFLIEDMRMNPNQFVVSGYSSYRPMAPNTTTANRAKNRRVEIIISKSRPAPIPGDPANLQ